METGAAFANNVVECFRFLAANQWDNIRIENRNILTEANKGVGAKKHWKAEHQTE